MLSASEEKEWQIGYYSKTKDDMKTFYVNENIRENPEEEVFKKPKTKIKELDPNKIKITFLEAIDKENKLQKEKYPSHSPFKKISILFPSVIKAK